MTKYKSSAQSIFALHLVNGAQFLNPTWVASLRSAIVIYLLKMQASLKSQILNFKTSALEIT